MSQDRSEALKICIDIYKHHFDLWLKGYFGYLAINGVIAGLVFGPQTSLATRHFLLLFTITISTIAVFAWISGLIWLRGFRQSVQEILKNAGIPALPLGTFELVVFLGLLGSIVIAIGGIVLLSS